MFQMPTRIEARRRLPRVLLGLVIFGGGIALMVDADLGLGPWDVLHQGISDLTGLSIGTIIILVGAVLLLVFPTLGELIGLGTLLNMIVIGLAVDATLMVLPHADAILARYAYMFAGPIVIGIGSGYYIGGGLGPGPRDGMMTGVARRGIPLWVARTGIEVSALVAGLALGGTAGIGTIWFAVSVGPWVHLFLQRLTMPAMSSA